MTTGRTFGDAGPVSRAEHLPEARKSTHGEWLASVLLGGDHV